MHLSTYMHVAVTASEDCRIVVGIYSWNYGNPFILSEDLRSHCIPYIEEPNIHMFMQESAGNLMLYVMTYVTLHLGIQSNRAMIPFIT